MNIDTKPMEILVVEDDDIDAKGIERAMNKLKIANKLHRAKDGIEALAMLRDGSSNRLNKPYIILLDINMPRMNGLEFLAEVRADEALQDAVVFILTTSKAEEDRIAAFGLHVAGYMVKSKMEQGFLTALNLIEHYWRIVEMPV
ncbi:MAG: CheY-like chemotaxis protein [Phenylobacterium sp.]|jgi:CheY-like chemotaxis protein